MSINWVMLDSKGNYVPLPRERTLYTSPARTSLSIKSSNSFPGKEPLNLSSDGGKAYITNQRLIYLPTKPTATLSTFSAPILHLLDTHVRAPYFGPNAWRAALKPVTGGGVPAHHALVELALTFKEGGAYDFQRCFDEVKEHLAREVERAADAGRQPDLRDVPLEQLPAYEEAGSGGAAARRSGAAASAAPAAGASAATFPPEKGGGTASAPAPNPAPPPPPAATAEAASGAGAGGSAAAAAVQPTPDEPPPGYEEAQSNSVMNSLEEMERRQNS